MITAAGNHGTGTGSFQEDPLAKQKKYFREMRWWLMASVAVLARAACWAWLNPPGGFWREDGDPVLRDTHWAHYVAFYRLDATALVCSLLIVVLLMSERSYQGDVKVVASFVGVFVAATTAYAWWSWAHLVTISCALVGFIYMLREMIRCLAKLKW